MDKARDVLMPTLGIVLSACGLAGFVLLFVRDMNVYWFILSPIILAVYQIPAVYVFYLWKKKRNRRGQKNSGEGGDDQ